MPLKLPLESVIVGELNVDKELPAIPVNLVSGITHLLTSLPSINT